MILLLIKIIYFKGRYNCKGKIDTTSLQGDEKKPVIK